MPDYFNKFTLSSPNLVNFICYPKFNVNNYCTKIKELYSLNLKFMVLDGDTVLNTDHIVGKGCEGLVLKVETNNDKIMALKIKRTDSCRSSMKNEFEYYKLANINNIGPRVYSYTDNLLLMELLEGHSAKDWFSKKNLDSFLVRKVIIDILNQSYILDSMNLDHGQLNRLNNHVIISDDGSKCTIVDFESASNIRRVNNLTSVFQGLILKGVISKEINRYINYENKKKEFLKLLKLYKNDKSRENFDSLIALI